MSAPAPAPPVCALCRTRPGVTRLPPSPLLLGERWHCDADRCVRLATSGRKVYLADAPPVAGDAPGAADHDAREIDDAAEIRARIASAAGPAARVIADRLAHAPRVHTDPLLRECARRLFDGHDPVEIIAATLLAYADDRVRLLDLATRASMLNGPVILAPADAFGAPAHNPGARVVATGGWR